MRQRSTVALCCLLPIMCLITSCAVPHSNTMVFATSTSVGLDVSSNPTAGGTPAISFGYRRQEGVWMPLLANKATDEAQLVPADCGNDCLFQGVRDKDTYSVLASFGLKFGASGEAQGTSANGDIAQYFATGLAAQDLAREGGAQLVTVQSTSDEDQADRVAKRAEEILAEFETDKQKILKFVEKSGKVEPNNLNTLIKGTIFEQDPLILGFANKPIADFQKALETTYRSSISKFAANIP